MTAVNISLEPSELAFRRPFTQEVTQVLTIKNTHYEPVAFKVKTTAPKQYCVRPNSGRIEAGQSVSVKVLLQAMKEDPPPDFKCRDKFLVQSVAITADRESQNANEIWQQVDKNDKSTIQERKIRVVFLPEPGTEVREEEPMVPHGDKAEQTGLTATPTQTTGTEVNSPSTAAISPVKAEGSEKFSASAEDSNPPSSPPVHDYQAQLMEARVQIQKLQKQLAKAEEEGARRRKAEVHEKGSLVSGGTITPVAITAAPEGVPVKIVAALCLLSFLLALLF